MSDRTSASPQGDEMLALYQRGLAAALAGNFPLAITSFKTVLRVISPLTSPTVYHDAALALATAYMACNQGDPRENARQAAYWHHIAQTM